MLRYALGVTALLLDAVTAMYLIRLFVGFSDLMSVLTKILMISFIIAALIFAVILIVLKNCQDEFTFDNKFKIFNAVSHILTIALLVAFLACFTRASASLETGCAAYFRMMCPAAIPIVSETALVISKLK